MNDRSKETFLGHPKGLFVLFFTELWERFSFYGMKAILVLYMVASVEEGGLGWSDAKGLAILGYYQLLVYLMSVPGGFVADKILGQRKSVYLGGLLLCAGHFLMAYPP
ncbi:MFS transporter, partial [bacterium]|nr:MFS transporter [bacterium]